MNSKITTILILLSISCFSLFGQETGALRGTVSDSLSHEALPFLNIFVNNTTLGTASNPDGTFELKNLPAGFNDIVFSYVGYETRIIRFLVKPGVDMNVGDIALLQKKEELAEIQIKDKRDKDWERKLKNFEKFFLGENNNSANCKIQNPWVINFSENSSKTSLEASASEPIEIYNYALGYKVYFYMSYFAADPTRYQIIGQFRFQEAEPLDEKQAQLWRKNRLDTYHGSERHLFKSIIEGKSEDEGFRLYVDKPGYNSPNRSDIFSVELNKSIERFDPKGKVGKPVGQNYFIIRLPPRLEVHYVNRYATKKYYKDVPFQVSWLEIEGGKLNVKPTGVVINSSDLVTSGAISASRVADLLPLDYDPYLDYGYVKIRNLPTLVGWEKYKRMQEFVHVQTDKPYYYPGERIWMRAFMKYRDEELIDSLSKVLYVELIDEKKNCIDRKYLSIDSASASGFFNLSDSIPKGNYMLRAYTNWMRNFGSEHYYVSPLPILALTDKVIYQQPQPDTTSLVVHFSTNQEIYHTRDSIGVTIDVSDRKGNAVIANMAVSVTDAILVKSIPGQPSITHFSIPQENKLDNPQFTVNYPLETGIGFSGLFTDDRGKPTKTEFSIVQRDFNTFLPMETNSDGRFTVTGLNFSGKLNFGFQALTKKDKPYGNFSISPKEFASVDSFVDPLPVTTVDMNEIQVPVTSFIADADTRVLEDIIIESTSLEEYNPTSAPIFGKPDYVVKGEDLRQVFTGSNLIQALQGKVPGLRVSYGWDENNQDSYRVRLRGGSSTMGVGLSGVEPLLIIDGIPFGGDPSVSVANFLTSIPVSTVERVEVITSAVSLLGTRGANGAILIYTKNSGVYGDANPIPNDPNMQSIPIQGYQVNESFPAPHHNKDDSRTMATDLRSTIHWVPSLTTDKNGHAAISFYAADLQGVYRVEVNGMASDGRVFRGEYEIKIENL